MIKASALYIVIVIALVIALICSSLIAVAYFYSSQYQQKFRHDRLINNLNSGINILLAGRESMYLEENTFSLLGRDEDSVSIKRLPWGIYNVGICKAFIEK